MKVTPPKKIPPMQDIGDGVLKTIIPQPFYSPNNVYLIPGKELVLIDSGYIESIPILQASLKTIGYSLKDIRHIIYTHNHVDHLSASLMLKSYAPKVKYYGFKGMAKGVGNYLDSMKLFQRASEELFARSYGDPEKRKEVLEKSQSDWETFYSRFQESKKATPYFAVDVEVEHETHLHIAGNEWKFLHTPGHNLYHITPVLVDQGIYFSGDLIIANLTAIYSELDGSLMDYYYTLDRLLQEPIRRLLPAHGNEIEDPKRNILLVRKTLSILEKGVLRRLGESDSDLLNLMESAIGKKVHSGGHLATALGLVYAILNKLKVEGKVEFLPQEDGYELFRLKR